MRPVGRPLHVDHAGARRPGADDRPRAHDPAHVGGEEDAVAGPDVRLVGGLAGDRDQEAAVHVQRTLRLAGRAGRVREQVGVLRVDLERRQLARPELDVPAPVVARPLDDVLDGRRLAQRLVDRLPHRHARAAAKRVVGGDHGLRLRVLQALHDRGRGEAGEDRHLDGADVRTRVGGDRGRRRHRHVDRDAVARPDAAARPAPPRAFVTCSDSSANVHSSPRAVLVPEDGGDCVGRPLGPHVQARRRDVQPRSLEPGRPLDPARVVEHAVPRTRERELEISGDGAPEAVGLVDREPVQLRIARAAERAGEPGDVRRLELFGRGCPCVFDRWVSSH